MNSGDSSSRFNVRSVLEVPSPNSVRRPSVKANGEPELNGYHMDTSENYVLSLRHLTREALPRIDQYRDARSIHAAARPSLDDLHNDRTMHIKASPNQTDEEAGESGHHKFGWIQGVLVLNIMSLWGPMLFLRTSWLVAQGGLIEGCVVILFSALITTITALSTSAIATNGEVKGGGTYYMLSRSLGPEYGGAIGLIFAFANMVGVAMNLVGFCETFISLLKIFDLRIVDGGVNDTRIIGICAAVFCIVICLVGMEWEQKAQNLFFLILVASILDVVVGSFLPVTNEQKARGITGWSLDTFKANVFSDYRGETFRTVFAVYFPSATGILSGANISGELKNPQTAIPRGTLLAILITTTSYIVMAIISGCCVVRDATGSVADVLANNYTDCSNHPCEWGTENQFQMLEIVAGFRWLIYAGNFAATISSALACLVGAPRVFQALCRDKIYPYIYFFEKGYGKSDDPIRCYGLTFVIAVAFILIGNLNAIAPIMSNFFLAAFCLINFACFHAALAKSPGFRPSFKCWNMQMSLVGSIMCLVVMFVMDWMTAIITIVICFLLYIYLYYKQPNVNWGSSAQAESYRQALKSVQELNRTVEHVKNYRPQLLVLTGKPSSRPPLVDFSQSITKGISLMVCGDVLKPPTRQRYRNELTARMYDWLGGRKCKAFYSPVEDASLENGVRSLIQLVGMGKLRPNMIMMGYKNNWQVGDPKEIREYFNIVHDAFDMYLAVGIFRLPKGLDYSQYTENEDLVPSPSPTAPLTKGSTVGSSMDSGLEVATYGSSISLADSSISGSTEVIVKNEKVIQQDSTEKEDKKKKKKKDRKGKTNLNIPRDVQESIDQFFKKPQKGTIDVWWLYDDGGLTLLIPYILSTRKHWNKCKLRVFSLANRDNQLDEEQRHMAALLGKFRIDCKDVMVLADVTKAPRDATQREFREICTKFNDKNAKESDVTITDNELSALREKTNRHLRIRELIQEHSKDATLIVMTLPMPRKNRVSSALYMSWLEMLTRELPPCLLIRGNQTSVLTFYS